MARGTHGRQGPPPDPNALRRDRERAGDWTLLPAEGRSGRAPRWPLTGQTVRESEIWAEEWRRPQAIMWELNGQAREVALYVRRLVQAEQPDAPVTVGTLVRQMQEALGVSVPGLARNKWRIESGGQPAASSARTGSTRPKRSSSRSRLKVVSGGDS